MRGEGGVLGHVSWASGAVLDPYESIQAKKKSLESANFGIESAVTEGLGGMRGEG